MLRSFTNTVLVSTALVAGGALAQTPAAPPQTVTSPTAPAATAPVAASSTAASGAFVTEQNSGEFRASKFVGVDIYGSENQKIGDVNEILMDANGQSRAIVIGVGGFLGIGEKIVAVPFSAVEWKNERMMADRPATTSGTVSATSPAATAARDGATTPGAMIPGGLTSSGTVSGAPMATTTPAMTTRSPAETAAYNGYPDHGVIKMTKADLQNAPAFKYYAETMSNAAAPGNAITPVTTAPRQ